MSDPVSLLPGPIITKITELAYAFGKNKYDEIYGVKDEIEKMKSNLKAIGATLKAAETYCNISLY